MFESLAGSRVSACLDPELVDAVRRQDLAAARALLDLGANPDAAEPDRIRVLHHGYYPTDCRTVLMMACDAGTPEATALAGMLLQRGADVTRRDRVGRTVRDYVERTAKRLARRRTSGPSADPFAILDAMRASG